MTDQEQDSNLAVFLIGVATGAIGLFLIVAVGTIFEFW